MALPSYHQNRDGDSTGLMAAPLRRVLCLAAVAAGNRGCTADPSSEQQDHSQVCKHLVEGETFCPADR